MASLATPRVTRIGGVDNLRVIGSTNDERRSWQPRWKAWRRPCGKIWVDRDFLNREALLPGWYPPTDWVAKRAHFNAAALSVHGRTTDRDRSYSFVALITSWTLVTVDPFGTKL